MTVLFLLLFLMVKKLNALISKLPWMQHSKDCKSKMGCNNKSEEWSVIYWLFDSSTALCRKVIHWQILCESAHSANNASIWKIVLFCFFLFLITALIICWHWHVSTYTELKCSALKYHNHTMETSAESRDTAFLFSLMCLPKYFVVSVE